MKKEERIGKYGKEAYEKMLQQSCKRYEKHPEEIKARSQEWVRAHPEEAKARDLLWRQNNPEKVKARDNEASHRGGRYYDRQRKYFSTGIPHEKTLVRGKHNRCWSPYKQIIAPDSQLHHQWYPETANYRGVALVEADQHLHGFIDVIQILEGEITLFREAEIRNNEEMSE